MRTFFTYELMTVLIDGETVENAKVVTTVRMGTQPVGNELEVSEKNRGVHIEGCVYLPETDEFVKYDEPEVVQEPTQLDRIESTLTNVESGTSQLLTDIRTETIDQYTLELVEAGLL